MNTECIQLFVQIVIYEISQIKRAFSAEYLYGCRINMTERQIESGLVNKPQGS